VIGRRRNLWEIAFRSCKKMATNDLQLRLSPEPPEPDIESEIEVSVGNSSDVQLMYDHFERMSRSRYEDNEHLIFSPSELRHFEDLPNREEIGDGEENVAGEEGEADQSRMFIDVEDEKVKKLELRDSFKEKMKQIEFEFLLEERTRKEKAHLDLIHKLREIEVDIYKREKHQKNLATEEFMEKMKVVTAEYSEKLRLNQKSVVRKRSLEESEEIVIEIVS